MPLAARAELVEFLVELASLGRTDVIALRSPDRGYRPSRVQSITRSMIADHLSGEQPLGLYLFSGTECRIGVVDLDDHAGTANPDKMRAITRELCDALIERGCQPFPLRSGGGKGVHIFVVFRNSQPAKAIRRILREALAECALREGTEGIENGSGEIFPKQDEVPEGGYGNLIALPFARLSRPLDPATLEPVDLATYRPPPLDALMSPDLPPLVDARVTRKSASVPPLPGDTEEAVSALKHIEADDYNIWIKIALALKHAFGDDGYSIWEEWSRKSPKFVSAQDCQQRWRGLRPRGNVGLGTIFYLAREKGWNGPSNPVIREMNARFGILTYGNKTQIILKNGDRRPDDESPLLGKQPFMDRLQTEKPVSQGEGNRPKPKGKFWFEHPLAAHYYTLDFDPAKPPGHNGRTWNLWSGFPYTPVPGEWGLLKNHLRENVCDADDEKFEWLLNWFAWGLQNPGEVIGTAVVLLGAPGVGKGVVANHYGALWEPHFVAVTQGAHVVGRFNAHLVAKRLVFVDEGMFGGNRKEAGVLKALVTEKFILMEPKGVDPIKMRNRAMFIVASNEASVVPADLGDRRWMVFEVNSNRKEDHAYFRAIAEQMKNGGYEAMMSDLLARDTKQGPSPLSTIKSNALFVQIIRAQPPYVQYFHRILDEGRLPQNHIAGPRSTTIKALHEDFRQQHPEARYLNDNALGRHLREVFPGTHSQPNGRYLTRAGHDGFAYERSTRYDFPPLPKARQQFEQKVGQTVPWSNDLADWQGDDDGGV